MKKNRVKGFTLIELIVVIAIIAVLSALLIPQIMGYVKKSKLTAANKTAKDILTNASAYVHETDSKNIRFTSISSLSNMDSTDDPNQKELCDYINKTFGVDDDVWIICFDDGSVTAAYYSKNSSDPYVGMAPDAANSSTNGGINSINLSQAADEESE